MDPENGQMRKQESEFMILEDYTCFVCYLPYNNDINKAIMICKEGQHHCCHYCYSQLFQGKEVILCPKCRRSIQKNQAVPARQIQNMVEIIGLKRHEWNKRIANYNEQICDYRDENEKLHSRSKQMESMVKDLITNYIKMQDELQLKEAESKSLQEITKKMEEENRKQKQSKEKIFEEVERKIYDYEKDVKKLKQQLANRENILEQKQIQSAVLTSVIEEINSKVDAEAQQCRLRIKKYSQSLELCKEKFKEAKKDQQLTQIIMDGFKESCIGEQISAYKIIIELKEKNCVLAEKLFDQCSVLYQKETQNLKLYEKIKILLKETEFLSEKCDSNTKTLR